MEDSQQALASCELSQEAQGTMPTKGVWFTLKRKKGKTEYR
jgi:hypothetical protein